jgi:hypothetical protein
MLYGKNGEVDRKVTNPGGVQDPPRDQCLEAHQPIGRLARASPEGISRPRAPALRATRGRQPLQSLLTCGTESMCYNADQNFVFFFREFPVVFT